MPSTPEDTEDPRIRRSRTAILEAVFELVLEQGVSGLSMEGVAARAGIAKSTVYRHFSSTAAMVVTVCEQLSTAVPPPPVTASVEDDVRQTLRRLAAELESASWPRLLAALVDASERDPQLAALHSGFFVGRRRPLEERLEVAVRAGDLDAGTDVSLLATMLVAPLFHRRYLSHEPLGTVADDVVAMALRAVRPSHREK